MLEKMPHVVGEVLSPLRAGLDGTAWHGAFAHAADAIRVTSPAFAEGTAIPAAHTADGPGTSPPLEWRGVPQAARAVVLLVEDADSPTPKPLVHAIAWNLPPGDGALGPGALPSPGSAGIVRALGENSFMKAQYLPPDPPTGHGDHRYLFQVYALDAPLEFGTPPGRGALIAAMEGRVIARGCLTGTYRRG
jgi:Raf kinase inhibitor-like YbhB/YbcL family protein